MLELVQQWDQELEQLHRRTAPRFRRAEPRQSALGYLRGLLSTCERKNGWRLAELIGETTPDGVQRLLNSADWDADQVRDDLRAYVVEHLGDGEAVLIVDETGFLKKGAHSVGVKRQYSGTPVGWRTVRSAPFCAMPATLGRPSSTGRSRPGYQTSLPKDWAEDEARRREADVPEGIGFATKPRLAEAMLERALDAGVPLQAKITQTCLTAAVVLDLV